MTRMLHTDSKTQQASPLDELQGAFQGVMTALGDRAMSTARQQIDDATDALNQVAAKTRKSEGGDVAGGLKRTVAGVGNKAKTVMSDVRRRH